ncbi:phosphatase PAP2 family protein [Candidatus Nitrospira salsa]
MIASFLHSFFNLDTRPSVLSRVPSHISILVCVIASIVLVGGISALSQIDFPIIQFIRATPVQVLAQLGQIGNRLGHGSTLVIISLFVFLAGYLWKKNRLKQIGVQTLVAHGISGLITQMIKHSIGRPRPRLAHQDHWQIGPSFQSGLDAFPSGHSSASFAVAAIIARHFPRYAWMLYGGAAFVALSRIIKGSHFPSDACVGAFLGYVIGHILARPIRNWRPSLIESLATGLPFFVTGLGLFWIAVHKPDLDILYDIILGAGILVMAVGYGIRLRTRLSVQNTPKLIQIKLTTSSLLIALGIALCSGSFLITTLATLSGVAWWVVRSHQIHTATESLHDKDLRRPDNLLAKEVLLGLGALTLVGLIHQLRGILPLVS